MIEEQGGTMHARHVEAYIRLEAATCEKMVRQGLNLASWHDQFGEYCGSVWIDVTPSFPPAGIRAQPLCCA